MANRLITNVLGCGLVLALLSGCASTKPKRIEISAKPVTKPELVLPFADQLFMRKIEWVLITPENFEEKVERIRKSGRPVVFFALTDKGYENISLNFSDVRSFIQQQNAIIVAYENYYKESNKKIDEANKNIKDMKAEVDSTQLLNEEKKPFWKFW